MPYQCTSPSCDLCGEVVPEKLARRHDLHCESCGSALTLIVTEEVRPEPADAYRADLRSVAEQLPTVLAMPVAELLEETNPVVGLWHICELAELSLRMLVLVGVAEQGKQLPAALARELTDRIDRPTMGAWLGMAQAVAAHLPADSLIPELKESVEKLSTILGNQASPPESGCLSLRNLLAHGGGMRRTTAEKYLAEWKPRVAEIVGSLAWLVNCQIVGRDRQGQVRILRGSDPQGSIASEDLTSRLPVGCSDALWFVRGHRALVLWPLGRYATCGIPDAGTETQERVAQIYIRRGEVRLQYHNLGGNDAVSESDSSALDSFLALFKVEEQPSTMLEFSVRGFESEFRKDANRRIGRESELAKLRESVNQMRGGLLWLGGVAGMGKSCLMATTTVELLENPPEGVLVLPYRFRASDDRCFRETFVRFACERIELWDGLNPREKELPETTKPVDRLKDCLARVKDGRQVLFVVDGLDEIAARDNQFVQEVILPLVSVRAGFICVGRPERGIPEALRRAGAIEPFPEGLPPMSQEDVRAMLVARTEGQLRKRLIKRDKESGDTILNPFIERVTRLSEGLPLYVNYVVGDVLSGKIAPEAEGQLPAGLHAYHEELLRRCAIGDLQAVVTPMVATLALAYEPLTAAELAALLVRRGVMRDPDVALVGRGLVALASMIRRAPNADGEDGYTLYHASLREHILASEGMRHTVGSTLSSLADAAHKPEGDGAEKYLYRCGVRHIQDQGRRDDALRLLTDFDYVMTRLQKLGGDKEAVAGYYRDWEAITTAEPFSGNILIWRDFLSLYRHLLTRGNSDWGAHKILLQIAIEHADNSPLTKAAETFLGAGRCAWLWIKNAKRPKMYQSSGCVGVLAGHRSGVRALELSDGRILSYSSDGSLRIWDANSSECVLTLKGHTEQTHGAAELTDKRILTWSFDHTLRVWDSQNGSCCSLLSSQKQIRKAIQLSSGRILSYSHDGSLKLWDADSGQCLIEFAGHTAAINGVLELNDARVVSWSDDCTLRIWDTAIATCIEVLPGHRKHVNGAIQLKSGQILSWSDDGSLRLWNESNGTCIALLNGHDSLNGHVARINGALELPNGRVVSWSADATVRVWEPPCESCALVLSGHTQTVNGAALLTNGNILSWSDDNDLRVWDPVTGECLLTLIGHTHPVSGACEYAPGIIMSWSSQETVVLLWNMATHTQPFRLRGHNSGINCAVRMSNGRILSWSSDYCLRIWQPQTLCETDPRYEQHDGAEIHGAIVADNSRVISWSHNDFNVSIWDSVASKRLCRLNGHTGFIRGMLTLPLSRVLSWSWDSTLRIWDIEKQQCEHVLQHEKDVIGAMLLSNGRILSWSDDNSLRMWDSNNGKTISTLHGHTNRIIGALELYSGHLVSWSFDKTIRVWDAGTNVCQVVIQGDLEFCVGHGQQSDGDVYAVKGNSFRELLADYSDIVAGVIDLGNGEIASYGRAMHIWNIETGKSVRTLRSPEAAFENVVRLSDGRFMLCSKTNGQMRIRLWDRVHGAQSGSWSPRELRNYDPDAWWAYICSIRISCENWVLDPEVGLVCRNRRARVAYVLGDKLRNIPGHAITESGLIVASSGVVIGFLRLMHGAQHIALSDAARLLERNLETS